MFILYIIYSFNSLKQVFIVKVLHFKRGTKSSTQTFISEKNICYFFTSYIIEIIYRCNSILMSIN